MSKETWIFDSVEKHKKKESLPKGGLEIVTAIGNKLIFFVVEFVCARVLLVPKPFRLLYDYTITHSFFHAYHCMR